MSEKNKTRLTVVAIVAICAILVWLLLRVAKPAAFTRVENRAGDIVMGSTGAISLDSLPPVAYSGGTLNYIGGSSGCLLCYKGYQRVETPTPVPVLSREPVPPALIINYIQQQAIQQANAYQRPKVVAYNY